MTRPYMAQAKHTSHLTPSFVVWAMRVMFGEEPETDPCWHPKSLVQPSSRCIVHPDHAALVDSMWAGDRRILIGDGLEEDWWGSVFMNCPYGRIITKWTAKAVAHRRGPVLSLLPAKTSTAWWRRDVKQAKAVLFLNGRLQFGDGELDDPYITTMVKDGKTVPRNQAPFPSALVLWDRSWRGLDAEDLDAAFGAFGDVWYPYQT